MQEVNVINLFAAITQAQKATNADGIAREIIIKEYAENKNGDG